LINTWLVSVPRARPRRRQVGPRPAAPPVWAGNYGGVMDDTQILGQIDELVSEEHELRGKVARGELSSQQERDRLRTVEQALDQCWDLLRQRRAHREFGEDPGSAEARPVSEVEGYLQ